MFRMVEMTPYIYLTNLPLDSDRKFLQELFSPYGTVKKVYICPTLEFAKVYLDSVENSLEAYHGVKENRYHIKLNIFIPPSYEMASSNESSNSIRPDISPNAYRSKKYTPRENDVNTSVTRNYVDVFGRVVTTLHDDDGDVYVSLTELKKSGFELFQHGSLPIRNSSIVYDEQKLIQFELYMKMKAAKFMSSHNFHVSDIKVNSIIQKEKNDYFHIQHVAANSTMRMSPGSSRRDTAEGFQPPINQIKQRNNENDKHNSDNRPSATYNDNKICSLMDIKLDKKNYHRNSMLKNENEYDNKTNQRNFKTRDQLNNSTCNTIKVEVNTTTPKRVAHIKTKQINNEEMNDVPKIVGVSLPLNVDHQVSVVHVESACEGWVQLLTNKNIIQSLVVDTMEECRNALAAKPIVGIICGALSTNIWFRAIVLCSSPLKVRYIDYGNEISENVGDLRQLSDKLISIPAQAIRIMVKDNPNIQLTQDLDLTITPTKQNHDGTYVVEVKGTQCPPSSKTSTNENRPAISPSAATSNKSELSAPPLRKPRSMTLKESVLKPEKKPQRRIVIEQLCDAGIFEFADMTSTRTFTGVAVPTDFAKEISILDEITDKCEPDPKFKPNIGDIVATHDNDCFVRGLVLSVSNGQYICALIDYGTIKIVNEVRQLPEDFRTIPEFSFECEADPTVIQELKAVKSTTLQIKSPYMLTLTTESGITYDIVGYCWNPLQPVVLNDNKTETQQQNIPLTELNQYSTLKITSQRSTVIESTCDRGIFDFVNLINDTSFIAFICPDTFTTEAGLLEHIGDDTVADPMFKPIPGELVAALTSDGILRGTVLNVDTNGNYECALIDYGTIKMVEEVRKLPEKYVNIAEFAVMCTADNKIVKDIQNNKCESLKICSPCVLTIKLESGKQYNIDGNRWIPFKSELPSNDLKLVKEIKVASKNNNHLQQSAPSTSKSDVSLKVDNTKTTTPLRKLAIEDCSENGYFDFMEMTSDNTFTCFTCPEKYTSVFAALDDIYKDTCFDKSFIPKEGDLVAVSTSESFGRGIVLKVANGKYECALIDDGTIKTATEVRSLPQKYVTIPEFACECKADTNTIEELQNWPCTSLAINSPCSLTLHLENGNQHVIKGYRWNPLATLQSTPGKKTKQPIPVKEDQPIMYKTPVETVLTDGDQVKIVGTQDNTLLVQNKESNSSFKIVSSELSNYKAKPFEGVPQVGTLAVCNFNDNKLYRVVINKLDANKATVEYIDYGDMNSVPINNLKAISEKLACINTSIIKIHLKDFKNRKFSDDVLNCLMECSEKKEKFIARKVAGEINTYDLIGSNGISLSEKFINRKKQNITSVSRNEKTIPNGSLEEKPNTNKQPILNKKAETSLTSSGMKTKTLSSESVCRLHDILKSDVAVGNNQLLCLYTGYLNEANVSFCKADEDTVKLLQHVTETIPNYIQRDNKPYVPRLFEVCLVKFEGEWCRGAIIKVNDDQTYGVFYVDYGNSHVVDSSEIRKLPEELSKIKALAMHCRIEGVLKENEETVNERLLSRLLEDVTENQVYDVNIVSIDKNEYCIIIPSLLEEWKSDGLL